MPASPEAIERRRARDRERDRKRRASKRAAAKAAVAKPPSPNRLTFRGPVGPEKSKSELRAMLAEAMFNTAQM